MKVLREADRPAVGLRERKKVKTRAAIQQHALRLFREQGYAATTVEQIAEAAEVSPSTFFRYFPSKEALVLQDEYDPLIVSAFAAQPPALNPIAALRRAMREVFADLAADDRAAMQERMTLIRSVPELRAAMLDDLTRTVQLLAEVAAERTGRRAEDIAVLTFAGAVIGLSISTMLAATNDPSADLFALLDTSLALLEDGLPL